VAASARRLARDRDAQVHVLAGRTGEGSPPVAKAGRPAKKKSGKKKR
jgi:hypothetical protein